MHSLVEDSCLGVNSLRKSPVESHNPQGEGVGCLKSEYRGLCRRSMYVGGELKTQICLNSELASGKGLIPAYLFLLNYLLQFFFNKSQC